METYYKVYYREDGGLKCTRYGYENENEALEIADKYASKDGVTDVEVCKYETVRTVIKRY